jgi:diguanylate cyclase (GGDEF)-like protein
VQTVAWELGRTGGELAAITAPESAAVDPGRGSVFVAVRQGDGGYRFEALGGRADTTAPQAWAAAGPPTNQSGFPSGLWSGPFRTIDGQWMVLARAPVRAPDGATGEPAPEGWVAASVSLEELLSRSGARSLLDSGFAYQFVVSRNAVQQRVVTGSVDSTLSNPLQYSIGASLAAPQEQWMLLTAPPGGWFSWTLLFAEMTLVVLVALFVALVAKDLAERGEQWRHDLETRDRRLREVHLRLSEEIEQREEIEKKFSYASFHDALTGLPNRAYFMERLGRALQRARLRSGYVAVIVVHMDKVRSVRETLGGGAGDDLLTQAVQRLQSGLRPEDLAVARLADDQFGVLLFGIESEQAAMSAAQRLQGAFEEPFPVAGQSVFATAGMGIAISSTGYEDADELVQGAQMALSKAGESGLALFDPATREQLVTRHQLETDLHHAIARREFLLHFQPIISLGSGRIAGVEALLRWRHPLEGMVSPARFIPLAEETGLIVPITRWVLREAARQVRSWRDRFHDLPELYVSVNLSAQDISQPDVCDYVEAVNAETGLPPGALRLEVTESMMIGNVGAISERLARFRQQGFRLLLDDFGTGYSSLGYLNRFQFDYIKIDRAFVNRIGADQSGGIVRAIIHLAHDLGTQTVAEGVETESEVRQLREMGCEFAQGFYFSKPMEGVLVEKLFESTPAWQSALAPENSLNQ